MSKILGRRTLLNSSTRFRFVDGLQPSTLCAKDKCLPSAVATKYLYTLDSTEGDMEWYTVVVCDGDALLSQCKSADRVYCKVSSVGGDTYRQT